MVKGEGGSQFEQLCRATLEIWCPKNGLTLSNQEKLSFPKPGGGQHFVDIEIISANNPNIRGLFSCKFQKTSGTTDEKLAYEVIKLLSAMGGTGWSESIIGFVKSGEIKKWIPAMKDKVTIFLNPNDLIQRAKDEIVL